MLYIKNRGQLIFEPQKNSKNCATTLRRNFLNWGGMAQKGTLQPPPERGFSPRAAPYSVIFIKLRQLEKS